MKPIVCIVGRSGTGKTTLIEKLIPEMIKRGYKVATLKHDVHGFEMDKEGKDTWRHKKAGAKATLISSSVKIGLISDVEKEMEPQEITRRFLFNADIVICEGYKKSSLPKIEVHRDEVSNELLCLPQENLIALVSDTKRLPDVPQVKWNEIEKLADIIEEKVIKPQPVNEIELEVNGKNIPLKPFVADMLSGMLFGSVSALKDCEDAREITIRARKK